MEISEIFENFKANKSGSSKKSSKGEVEGDFLSRLIENIKNSKAKKIEPKLDNEVKKENIKAAISQIISEDNQPKIFADLSLKISSSKYALSVITKEKEPKDEKREKSLKIAQENEDKPKKIADILRVSKKLDIKVDSIKVSTNSEASTLEIIDIKKLQKAIEIIDREKERKLQKENKKESDFKEPIEKRTTQAIIEKRGTQNIPKVEIETLKDVLSKKQKIEQPLLSKDVPSQKVDKDTKNIPNIIIENSKTISKKEAEILKDVEPKPQNISRVKEESKEEIKPKDENLPKESKPTAEIKVNPQNRANILEPTLPQNAKNIEGKIDVKPTLKSEIITVEEIKKDEPKKEVDKENSTTKKSPNNTKITENIKLQNSPHVEDLVVKMQTKEESIEQVKDNKKNTLEALLNSISKEKKENDSKNDTKMEVAHQKNVEQKTDASKESTKKERGSAEKVVYQAKEDITNKTSQKSEIESKIEPKVEIREEPKEIKAKNTQEREHRVVENGEKGVVFTNVRQTKDEKDEKRSVKKSTPTFEPINSQKENQKESSERIFENRSEGAKRDLAFLVRMAQAGIGKNIKESDSSGFSNRLEIASEKREIQTKKGLDLDIREPKEQKSDILALKEQKVDNQVRNIMLKETIRNFSHLLRDEIKQYKPPISKISLELNPEKLGSVEVTITSRGNNLNVNISSNQGAMMMFMQNSAEFRNTMQNLGFNNIDMSFNSNSDDRGGGRHDRGNQDEQKGNNNSLDKYIENEDEAVSSIDLTIPRYI